MNAQKKFRLILAAILCGGLLLTGIGAGVAFGEFSRFTYGGTQLLETAEPQREQLRLELHPGGDPIDFSCLLEESPFSYSGQTFPREQIRVRTDETLTPGTVLLDLGYCGVSARPIAHTWEDEEGHRCLEVGWSSDSSLGSLLACKDQLLRDLRGRTLSTYLTGRLTAVTVTLNPADARNLALG